MVTAVPVTRRSDGLVRAVQSDHRRNERTRPSDRRVTGTAVTMERGVGFPLRDALGRLGGFDGLDDKLDTDLLPHGLQRCSELAAAFFARLDDEVHGEALA